MGILRKHAGVLGLLVALYASQGLPFGFFTQALPVMLRARGVSLELIGLTSILALPWALKFLWAPFVDTHYHRGVGRRRSWILAMQFSAVVLIAAVAFAPPLIPILIAAVFLTNLIAATQDIATDGLAVSILTPEIRGVGNGIQVAGYRIGMIIGGGVLLIAFDALGWTLTFGIMALTLVLASVPVLLYRENAHNPTTSDEPRPSATRGTASATWREVMGPWFQDRSLRTWLGAIMFYKLGSAIAGGMVRPIFVDLGFSMADIGWILGTSGFVAGMAGALIGGFAASKLGHRPAVLLFGVAESATIGLYALAGPLEVGILGASVLSGLEHLAGGMATAALFTMMMDKSDGLDADFGGTSYTVQASAVVIATGVGVMGSGFLAGALGPVAFFIICAAISFAGVAAIWRVTKRVPA